jgi:hypothetical protein
MITDWKGNEIKPGMEICLIKVIDRHTMVFGMLIPLPDGGHKEYKEEKRPDSPCWEVGNYYLIDENFSYLAEDKADLTLRVSIHFIDFSMDKRTHILAIKGISDNREEYEQFRKDRRLDAL